MRVFCKGLLASLAIAIGYLPIAFSFGLTALQAGLPASTTVLISAVVFAGASQFVLIALLASGAGLVSVLPTVALMNARHLFYGPALLGKLAPGRARLPAPLLSFGLTDEVFATAMGRLGELPDGERETWFFGLQSGAYLSWLLGTVLGVLFGAHVAGMPVFLREALDFILPALFVVLLLDMGVLRHRRSIVATGVLTLVLLRFLPDHHALAFGMLGGALCNLLGPRR